MPSDLTQVRRRSREVTDDEWMADFLEHAATCVIGSAADGRTFLNPNTFVYDRERDLLYFHTAGSGRTRTNLTNDARVTICVFEMGRLLPAPVVTDYSTEYASVVLFGRVTIVDDPAEVRMLFERQMKKYFPHKQPGVDYVPFTDAEAAKATVYRVTIEERSAKKHDAAPDHEGALRYPWSYFAGR